MENIGNITGFWQFAAMIFLTIFVPYFTKWLQTKEFKKSEDKNEDFNNKFRDKSISLFAGIGNNMNVYIVEVPNETAPSIQGFAKPPA